VFRISIQFWGVWCFIWGD